LATPHQKAEHERLGANITHQRSSYSHFNALLHKMLNPPPDIPGGKKGPIVFALVSRGVETALAVRLLVDHKPPLVDDACALVRIFVESVINAAFITISDESMAHRFDAWGDYQDWKQGSYSLKSFPKKTHEEQTEAETQLKQLYDQALQEFPDFKDQRGDGFWGNLHKRAKVIDDAVGQRHFAMMLETWRELSNYVHQNPNVVRQRITEEESSIAIGRMYTEADQAKVLFACNEALFGLCWMLDEFYWKKSYAKDWDRLSREWRPYAYEANHPVA
jgi:hypothetical protein